MNLLNKKVIKADASLLIVAFLWGSSFVVTKGSLNTFSPFYLVGLRFGFALVIGSIIFYKKIVRIKFETLKSGLIVGLILFIAFAFQTTGLKYLEAGKQAFMTSTNVVMVPFIYWLLEKQKPDMYAFVGSILTITGIGVLTLNSDFTVGVGEILTLLSAFFYALHVVSIGHFTKDHDTTQLVMIQIGTTGILSLLTAFIFEGTLVINSFKPLFSVIYMAVFTTIVAFYIQTSAQKNTPPTHAAIIISLESVFATILSITFMNEVFNYKMVFGCIIIFIAIITTETKWEFIKKGRNNSKSSKKIS